jgi:lipid-A-disaccharide synthase
LNGSDPGPPLRLLVVAGEASGDLHGARLLSALRRLRPEVEAFGLGGDELRAAGLDPVAHSSEIAVVGLFEALKVLRRARQIFRLLLEEADRRRPEVALLIDSPEFNLRLAAELKARGVKVVYYVSPQVWAWRRRRVHTIERVVDRMLVLFPFEVDFYRRHGVDVLHVGHPLVDEVPQLPQVWDQPSQGAIGEGEAGGRGPFRVALLPGSRESEIAALLDLLVRSAERLAERLPIEVVLVRAPTIPLARLEERTRTAAVPIAIRSDGRFDILAGAHLALCASGTATLEVGLLGTPLLIVYRLRSWTYFLAKRLVKLPYVSLVNLVLGRPVVPELIQDAANPARVAAEAYGLLTEREGRERMRAGLSELRPALGTPGASERAAAAVLAVCEQAYSERAERAGRGGAAR